LLQCPRAQGEEKQKRLYGPGVQQRGFFRDSGNRPRILWAGAKIAHP